MKIPHFRKCPICKTKLRKGAYFRSCIMRDNHSFAYDDKSNYKFIEIIFMDISVNLWMDAAGNWTLDKTGSLGMNIGRIASGDNAGELFNPLNIKLLKETIQTIILYS